MSRMNGRVTGNPTDLGVDFEPSCLVRTPSGNVYIPSGNISKSCYSLFFPKKNFPKNKLYKKTENFVSKV